MPSTPVNNNNYESEGDEGVLKIDEEADVGKENRIAASPASNKQAMADDDIVDLEESNGISTEDDEEEEPISVPGPGGDITHTPCKYTICYISIHGIYLIYIILSSHISKDS